MQTARARAHSTTRHHHVFLQVLGALQSVASLQQIADASSVSYGTLWQWLYGNTLHPNTRTLFAVAHTLGFQVTLTERPKNKYKLRAVK